MRSGTTLADFGARNIRHRCCFGLGGMALALLLRLVQHIAYGHGPHIPAGQQGFLQEVTAASDLLRFLALCSCGAVAGIGWWLLYRLGSALVSIAQAVRKGERMPFWADQPLRAPAAMRNQ